MKQTITVRQVLRIERETTIEIEAVTHDAAISLYDEGDHPPLPSTDSGQWVTVHQTLENEEVS